MGQPGLELVGQQWENRMNETAALTKDEANLEYIDVSSNLRHWNILRFAKLTIFIAAMCALMNITFGGRITQPFTSILKVAGLLVAISFLIQQERTMSWRYRFIERAAELEEILGFQQYRNRPQGYRMTGRVAMRLFFFTIILFWIVSNFLHY